jgi:hypothetical protein
LGQGGSSGQPPGGQPPAGARDGFDGPGGPGGSLDAATLDYLVANQGSATWIVAVSGATTAGQIELSTGRAVMAMGGFTGSDNAPTLGQLKSLIASGALRFVVVGGGGPGGGGPGAGSSDATSWVSSACTAVTIDGSSTSVFDCVAAGG